LVELNDNFDKIFIEKNLISEQIEIVIYVFMMVKLGNFHEILLFA